MAVRWGGEPQVIDLRSETCASPTLRVIEAMTCASFVDDIFDRDPTIARLEEAVADLFGFERALLCASGTGANLVAMVTHSVSHAKRVVAGHRSHIAVFEGCGIESLADARVQQVSNTGDGGLDWAQLCQTLGTDPGPCVVCYENTHNLLGGVVAPDLDSANLRLRREKSVKLHLDGARALRAAAATERDPATLTLGFDSAMVSLTKGAGAPMGAVLLGGDAFIEQARVFRSMVGGAMHQAGPIAAAGLAALENWRDRFALEHSAAMNFSRELTRTVSGSLRVSVPQTNIVLLSQRGVGAQELADELQDAGVRTLPVSENEVRAVFAGAECAERASGACERISDWFATRNDRTVSSLLA